MWNRKTVDTPLWFDAVILSDALCPVKARADGPQLAGANCHLSGLTGSGLQSRASTLSSRNKMGMRE